MSRCCVVTGKSVMTGNNVSHANNKTRRRFLPNLRKVGLYSEVLSRKINIKVSSAGLRTIEHNGGIDAWLISTPASKLDDNLRKIREQVVKVSSEKSAA